MKFVILFALFAVAFAQEVQDFVHDIVRPVRLEGRASPIFDEDSELVNEIREQPVGAAYRYLFELKNGMQMEETGQAGSAGQAIVVGRYYYVSPEGLPIEVTYTADENGFVANSDSIPVDHPLPAHVVELIKIGEQQRAEGVQFDTQGFRI